MSSLPFQVPSNNKFCNECGKPLEELKNKCNKCGAEIDSNAKFCPECGAAQNLEKFCSNCNAKMSQMQSFAQNVGLQMLSFKKI